MTDPVVDKIVAKLYTPDERRWDLNEPIEVRLQLGKDGKRLVLTAFVRNGLVQYVLNNGTGGPPESLSNMQVHPRGVRHDTPVILFPTKAVKGWQDEVLAFANNSLYTVTEVR